jgi:phosphatidylserine/phosphatidylglycerophosphate/cardiolipin synthase-like enzyme
VLAFGATVDAATTHLGPARLRDLADCLAAGEPAEDIFRSFGGDANLVGAILAAQRDDRVPADIAATYLRGVAAGYAGAVATSRVEVVWSGPASPRVPVRATAQVIASLIAEAQREILLVTYSARPYQPVIAGLTAAISRGVEVSILVETLQGAGSTLSGSEPANAFATVEGVVLWHWPAHARPTPGSKMHAKIAVADRRVLFASSVNLTQSAVEHSIEAGVLVHGGTAPRRAAEHIQELQASGVLQRLS